MQSHVTFDHNLINRYNVNGPRYTSYPTALQFGPFTAADLTRAIAASPRVDRDLSLYCHLPFCATLCYYCACNKIVTKKRDQLAEYLDILDREMAMLAPHFAGRPVSQLHWGGGTPTFLDDNEVSWLMSRLRHHFNLVEDDNEFSIEIDPRTVDAGRIAHLRQAGFNRLSFGVQDFNEEVQRAVNRRQGFDETRDVVLAARASGFQSVSMDLIYGLPHQTRATFDTTLDQVVELRPDRLSIYNYAHLPDRFTPQQRILASDLPAPAEKLAILELCIEKLSASGYVYIGMDHFALPHDELAVAQQEGSLQRNFQGYSTRADCDLLALGITGISNIGNTYSQNARELPEYRDAITAGELPVVKGVAIDAEDQLRAIVIRRLICDFALSFSRIEAQFAIDFASHFAAEMDALAPMADDGLITLDAQGITVTDRGRLFVRNICMVFDRYLAGANQSRFSRAV